MKWRRLMPLVLCACAFSLPASAQIKDIKGAADPELFTRMPDFYLSSSSAVTDKAFDVHEFIVKPGTRQRVEGRVRRYVYTFDPKVPARYSRLQIIRNYQGATTKLGGTVVHEDNYRTTMLLKKDGKETWVAVEPGADGRQYALVIVDRQAMEQDVVGNAEALGNGLTTSGHVEVPGILFDFGKADVKPDSEPALKEVVKLLQANAALRVWVVGHTDNVGGADANVTLSNARAASVVKALQQMGIDSKRLAAHGVGPYSPVASNTTEDGRTKNRRVELVAQ